MAEKRKNPYAAFNFVVSHSSGANLGGFMEVTGLDTENAVIEYREGSDQKDATGGAFVRKSLGWSATPT